MYHSTIFQLCRDGTGRPTHDGELKYLAEGYNSVLVPLGCAKYLAIRSPTVTASLPVSHLYVIA